jgi:hypothetical protein
MASPIIFHRIYCRRADILLLHTEVWYLVSADVMSFWSALDTHRWSHTSKILHSELVLQDIRFVLTLLRARPIARVTKVLDFFEFLSVRTHLDLARRVNPCSLA